MSDKFRTINRDTPFLLPPSLQDWLPEDHLARFVVDIVDRLDLSALERDYGGGGKHPYHPAVLLSLLFYGYATGVFSSRKLEQATYDSVAFRFITADTHPDHDTIATFRRRFLREIEGLFVQVLGIAQELGFLKLGHVSVDGTKIKANASKHKAMSWGYANRLEEQLRGEVASLLAQAEAADAQDEPAMDIPEELARREDRLAAIAKAKAQIEQRARERFEAEQAEYEAKLEQRKAREEKTGGKPPGNPPKPPQPGPRDRDQVNFTDEESRIMPSAEGFVQAYNARAVVALDSHLIVANHLTQQPNDKQQVVAALAGLEALETQPDGLLADSGYFSEDNVARCEAAGITPLIATAREKHNQPLLERYQAPPRPPEEADALARMKHRLKTPEGKASYARSKSPVETVFGIIKHAMGFRQFHLRGKAAVQGEWNLVSLAWNLKRMFALAGERSQGQSAGGKPAHPCATFFIVTVGGLLNMPAQATSADSNPTDA